MHVNQLRYFLAFSLIFMLLQLPVAHGQVFPGDADNNGVVNHLDVLNVGYAFGSTGPARLESGGQPSTQQISVTWEEFFPQGLNFSFADADGNGWVNYIDLATIASNYGETHDSGTETISFYPGVPEIHSPIILDKSEVPSFPTEGTIIEIPVYLGEEALPLESFQGIAFTIEYDSDFVADLEFSLDESSWINAGEGSFDFIGPELELGKKEVTVSRKGANPVFGDGKIGTLSLIVIDDLGTLLASPADSSNVLINITNIRCVNGDFWVVPIASDSVEVMVYGPDALPVSTNDPALEKIKIYPNPVETRINVESPVEISAINVYNLFGARVFSKPIPGEKIIALYLPADLPSGFYFIQIETQEGLLTRKLMIGQN